MILRNLERQPVRTFISVLGIAFAVAVLLVGLAFIDVMEVLITQQFVVAMRQDATVNFVEPRSARATYAVEHLPGVMDVEPMRACRSACAPGRDRARSRSSGCPPNPV
jgi:putative ABC transport system permease protein